MLTQVELHQNEVDLPAGYTARPATLADVEAVVALFNACARALSGTDENTVAEWDVEWRAPGFNPSTDTRLVLAPDGQLAGCVLLWLPAPYAQSEQWGRVHPAQAGRGLGTYLFAWAEARARQAAEQAPAGARVTLTTWLSAADSAAKALLADQGCAAARHSLRMLITLDDDTPPPAPQAPAGITLRTFVPGQDDVATYRAIRESFRDSWDYVEVPFEDGLARWRHRWQNRLDFDPSLRFLALAGDEVIGTAFCQMQLTEDPQLAWIFTVGVRRPWRRQGVALALLQACFAALYARGRRQIGLGVDADSPTGATRLYERAGMRPVPEKTYEIWEKELIHATL